MTRSLIGSLALLASISAAAVPARAQEYKVVVNASASVAELPAATVSKIFLKQERKLPGGANAVPVDLVKTASTRAAFTRVIHGRAVGAVEQYWQQQLFSGRDTPPESKPSDDEVLAL